MMRGDLSFVDLPKDRRLVVDDPIAPRKQAVRQVADLAGIEPGSFVYYTHSWRAPISADSAAR